VNEDNVEVLDNLMGTKSQYLLLNQGAFNLSANIGTSLKVEFMPAIDPEILNNSAQLDLFK
jgi:hypothetical protein